MSCVVGRLDMGVDDNFYQGTESLVKMSLGFSVASRNWNRNIIFAKPHLEALIEDIVMELHQILVLTWIKILSFDKISITKTTACCMTSHERNIHFVNSLDAYPEQWIITSFCAGFYSC